MSERISTHFAYNCIFLYVSRSSFSLDPLENLRRLVSFSSSFVYESQFYIQLVYYSAMLYCYKAVKY